jgi:hypothetical protein
MSGPVLQHVSVCVQIRLPCSLTVGSSVRSIQYLETHTPVGCFEPPFALPYDCVQSRRFSVAGLFLGSARSSQASGPLSPLVFATLFLCIR